MNLPADMHSTSRPAFFLFFAFISVLFGAGRLWLIGSASFGRPKAFRRQRAPWKRLCRPRGRRRKASEPRSTLPWRLRPTPGCGTWCWAIRASTASSARAGNPMLRGKPPFEWPVNGFFFEDPKSGYWYAYVGNYLAGYAVGPDKPASHCTVHRSKDRGKTWEDLGPIFRDPGFRFEGDTRPATMPRMCRSCSTAADTTWPTIGAPTT